MNPKVGIIMGSDSDLPVMSKAAEILDKFGIPYELTIISAHRTPDRMYTYAKTAHERGIKVIIAGAGGAASPPATPAPRRTPRPPSAAGPAAGGWTETVRPAGQWPRR